MNFKFFSLLKCIVVLGLVADHGHSRHHRGIYYHHHQYKHNRHHGPLGNHHWHRHVPLLNFEIRTPKGLTVSTIQRSPNTTFFGIQIFVDKVPNNNATPCDICLNTTKVTYGKFIVEDNEAVIKKGDVLYYRVLFGNNNNITRMQLQKIIVSDSIINKCSCDEKMVLPKLNLRFGEADEKPSRPTTVVGQKPSLAEIRNSKSSTESIFDSDESEHRNELFSHEEDASFECDPDPATNLCRTPNPKEEPMGKQMQSLRDYEQEIQILESIIEQMKSPCGPKRVTNILLLKMSSWETVSNKEQALDVVRSSLSFNSDMREIDSKIRLVVAVSDSRGRSISFEMPSYVEKQKVLYHARLNKLEQIVDYDLIKRG